MTDTPPSIAPPIFGRAHAEFITAKVGNSTYGLIPRRARFHLSCGSASRRPIVARTSADFYGHGGSLAHEAAFRAAVNEQHRHQVERARLGRRDVPAGTSTPWCRAKHTTGYGPGVRKHATAERTIRRVWPDVWKVIYQQPSNDPDGGRP